MIKREKIAVDFLRHGVTERSGLNAKPSYEDFVKFYGGSSDDELNEKKTEELIGKKIEAGQLKAGDFDLIITSNFKRAVGTAEMIRKSFGFKAEDLPIRRLDYLREVEYSVKDIPPEVYAGLKDLDEAMTQIRRSFIEHGGNKETLFEVYKRCLRILDYIKNIKDRHGVRPLFISHGFIIRLLQLAIRHQHENLTEEEVKELARKEFIKTVKPRSLTGLRINLDNSKSDFINLE